MTESRAPLTDPRTFAEVLRDWMQRHALTYDAASDRLDLARASVGQCLNGRAPRQEKALRALMTLVDEGRA